MKGKIEEADSEEILQLLDAIMVQSDGLYFDSAVFSELREKIQDIKIKKSLRRNLLKKIEKLEKKQSLVKTLSNLTKQVIRKGEKGTIENGDVDDIIKVINEISKLI